MGKTNKMGTVGATVQINGSALGYDGFSYSVSDWLLTLAYKH